MLYGLVVAYTDNLGDDIQSLAALQFYPRVDVLIHREYIGKVKVNAEIKVILNGWFMYKPWNWPPPRNIIPLIISFHIDPFMGRWMLSYRGLSYFKQYEPIGTRDIYTMFLLKNAGITSYFSSCLTLTLDYGYSYLRSRTSSHNKYIVLVDVPSDISILIKRKFRQLKVVSISHEVVSLNDFEKLFGRALGIVDKFIYKTFKRREFSILSRLYSGYVITRKGQKLNIADRFKKAHMYLYLLANASCVITTRLHAALPSLAFKTPTILLTRNPNDLRFSGYSFIPIYHIDDFVAVVRNTNDYDDLVSYADRATDYAIINYLKQRLIDQCLKFMRTNY